jgi:hypothetical protein
MRGSKAVKEFRSPSTGRRGRTHTDETGHTWHELAPLGDDGEAGLHGRWQLITGDRWWPFAGRYYGAGGPGPKERWYELRCLSEHPFFVYGWERCAPPPGQVGEAWPKEDTGTIPIEELGLLTEEKEDEQADTVRSNTLGESRHERPDQ